MLIAVGTLLALICELLPFLNLPFGGTITVCSLLPVIVISWMYGPLWGLASGFIFSLIQIATGYSTVSALFMPTSDSYMGVRDGLLIILIDYIIAYTVIGLGGTFRNIIKNKAASLVVGSVFALTLCYLAHTLSGVIFYGAWAEWFFTDTVIKDWQISKYIMENFTGNGLATVYSFVYNGCYMIPEIIITAIGAAAVSGIPQVEKE